MKVSLTLYYEMLHAEALRISADCPVDVVGVTGGREFENRPMAHATLMAIDAYCPFNTLINGGARGLDTLAADWATSTRKTVRTLPARWLTAGKAAGPIRNSDMVEILLAHSPRSALIAFPGNEGTIDMCAKCNQAGIKVIDIQAILDRLHGS